MKGKLIKTISCYTEYKIEPMQDGMNKITIKYFTYNGNLFRDIYKNGEKTIFVPDNKMERKKIALDNNIADTEKMFARAIRDMGAKNDAAQKKVMNNIYTILGIRQK